MSYFWLPSYFGLHYMDENLFYFAAERICFKDLSHGGADV